MLKKVNSVQVKQLTINFFIFQIRVDKDIDNGGKDGGYSQDKAIWFIDNPGEDKDKSG